VQLDKLLRLRPSKLPLRSKASSRAKGKLAANVTGEANQLIGRSLFYKPHSLLLLI
jgi:hypothetical protein